MVCSISLGSKHCDGGGCVMDDALLVLLVLFDGPKNPEEACKYMEDKLGDECPCGFNDIGLILTELADASDYVLRTKEGKFAITAEGIVCLLNNKTLDFIYKQKKWMDELSAAGRI